MIIFYFRDFLFLVVRKMVTITENVSLQSLNTFGIDARAAYFSEVFSIGDLKELIRHPIYQAHQRLILGGGSNLLFKGDFNGLVIKSSMGLIRIVSETGQHVLVQIGSGVNWHTFVITALRNDWGGIENLSLIPGTCGAAPIQNIGAYGVEIKNVIENVDAVDLETGEERTFNNAECRFNYRESVFKQELREKYFVSSITLRLTKKNHIIHAEYGAIREVLSARHIDHPTIQNVSDAVIAIRQSKLPDPAVTGNAGSFFKNPVVSKNHFELIRKEIDSVPSYPVDNQNVKIPAGWLIEQCGWKGKKIGNVGVHPAQALVLVNYGGGKGEEIFQLAMKIRESVKIKFAIDLTTEVNII